MSSRSFPDMLRTQLEPSVAETMGSDVWGLGEIDRAVAISQAISLRRIADALSDPAGLNEVLTCAVSGLSNTLAEHRMYSR
jgi:hypothetical protein